MRRLVAIVSLMVIAAGGRLTAQLPVIWDGIYTFTQSDRGQLLYGRHCSRCHGEFLEGRPGPPPPLMLPMTAPPLVGTAFRSNWNAMKVADLFERIRVSMPQQAPGSLSRQQNADIVAYILGRNGFPSGPQELPPTLSGATSAMMVGGW